MKLRIFTSLLAVLALTTVAAAPVEINYSRQQLQEKWRDRIQSFLDKGVIPLIDLESSLKRGDGEDYLDDALPVMDKLGLALIAFDGYSPKKKGDYLWGYYIHEVVNAYPDRFILATNGGTNKDWLKERDDYLGQLEEQVRDGAYPIMGEFDFRHYMSSSQCKKGKTGRDNDIPLDGDNGQRLFRLSAETGVPFIIHHEPEDHALEALEAMLKAYPKAKVIVAHFGQIRHPEKETRFRPDLARRLFMAYPNLYYDLSTGKPGRRYKCNNKVLDTVIWQGDGDGQTDTLKSEYKNILSEFSGRFVAGTDYGGGRPPLPEFLRNKVKNLRLIMRDLPDGAKHDIGYRNAWKLLTGKRWGEAAKAAPPAAEPKAEVAQSAPDAVLFTGIISDGHGHFKGNKASAADTIAAMDRNNIDVVVHWVKNQGGWKDSASLEFSEDYPGRVIPGIAFQNTGWTKQKKSFIEKVRKKAKSGDFKALGEVSVRGKIGGKQNSPPDSPLLKEVLDISAKYGLPVTIHHNPYRQTGGGYERTDEYETFIEETLTHNTDAPVIWAHWCGQSTPKDARKLLERFPNLVCDLAWLHFPTDKVATPLVDENSHFIPAWKKLIEDMPDRFIVGVDSSATPKNIKDYDKRVRKIRAALGGLSLETAKKLATENLHRAFRLP